MGEIGAAPPKAIAAALARWQMDETAVLERVYRAPTPRERERWHALWLLAQDRTVARVAELLRRDPHTIARWLADFAEGGPKAVAFAQTGGPPRSRPCGTDRSERGGAGASPGGGPCLGQLVPEGGQTIHL